MSVIVRDSAPTKRYSAGTPNVNVESKRWITPDELSNLESLGLVIPKPPGLNAGAGTYPAELRPDANFDKIKQLQFISAITPIDKK